MESLESLEIAKSNSVNLVIAFYFGSRIGDTYRNENTVPVHDIDYVKKHVYSLNNFKHNLSQITCVVAKDPEDFTDYSKSFPSSVTIGALVTPLRVLQRHNEGLSFGSWKHAVQMYKDSFDYYIFIEDDYIFVQDHFDRILVNGLKSSPYCDFFVVYKGKGQCISMGVIASNSLKKLNWLDNCPLKGKTDLNEVQWTNNFRMDSFKDNTYVWPYYTRIGIIIFYCNNVQINVKNQKIVLAPSEILTEKCQIKYPEVIHVASTKKDVLDIVKNVKNKKRNVY